MMFLNRNLSRLFRTTTPLKNGRWTREHADRKIDLANHEHCGGPLCAETKLTKSNDNSNKSEYDNSMDVAVCALQSFHVNPTKF